MAIFGQYLLDRKADIERDATREIPRQPDIAGIWPALASATRHGRLPAVFANRTNEKLLIEATFGGPGPG